MGNRGWLTDPKAAEAGSVIHPDRQVRERTVLLLDDVRGFTAKAVTANDAHALAVSRVKPVVDRDLGRVLMGSMLLLRPGTAPRITARWPAS